MVFFEFVLFMRKYKYQTSDIFCRDLGAVCDTGRKNFFYKRRVLQKLECMKTPSLDKG